MALLQIIVLAAVQGLTEFLPISSSAHLILVPAVTGWPDQGLTIDVAVHVGTLGAVIVYLWRDAWAIIIGLAMLFRGRILPGARLFGKLVLATIPVIIAGYLLDKYYGGTLRSIEIIGWSSLVFGLLLYVVDMMFMTVRRMEDMPLSAAMIIGTSQVLALIPGTSRSGITMTAARLLGYERQDAARFSMLLSIPTIVGAGALKGYELYQSGNAALGMDVLLSVVLTFGFALVAIILMMSWLRRASFTPFVIYRVLLGVLLIAWVNGLLTGLSFMPAPPS